MTSERDLGTSAKWVQNVTLCTVLCFVFQNLENEFAKLFFAQKIALNRARRQLLRPPFGRSVFRRTKYLIN